MCADFDKARALAEQRLSERDSIGRLQEKRLHATLKYWLDTDETHHEIPLPCGAVADIFDGERVIEIQNGNFSPFRIKLCRLLEEYPVTVIYPLPRKKTIYWTDPATGDISKGTHSTKIGTFTDAAPELLFIAKQLFHPNLTVKLQLLDMDEYKLQDGWGNDGKRGAHRLERVPTARGECLEIRTKADLKRCLPAKLPLQFTSADFQKCTRWRGRRLSAALKLFLETGVITREKQGNKYIYTVV